MLAIDGVVGVNLSGSATAGPETDSAAIMAEVAETLTRSVAVNGCRHGAQLQRAVADQSAQAITILPPRRVGR